MERLLRLARRLLTRREDGVRAPQLGASPRHFDGHLLAGLLQLQIGDARLRARQFERALGAQSVENGPRKLYAHVPVLEPATVLTRPRGCGRRRTRGQRQVAAL